eukprot:CAMPEP_0113542434 /NCGR_PEP_ID=MMETSP0015_2-20120614/9607_1 /TAXON_ID=2838 /ORGANISM="Odontella" /LENGTH=426 /DNA_ID=CAMNT_0000442495 /DNA_START=117 /DNA_END=1400 /DNA_ORIENTATION=+ /assembly_acc=CAM_ASM_000160
MTARTSCSSMRTRRRRVLPLGAATATASALLAALSLSSLPSPCRAVAAAAQLPPGLLTADALFDALDLDGDGLLRRQDVRDGLERIELALGLDVADDGDVDVDVDADVGAAGRVKRQAKDLGGAPPPKRDVPAPGSPGIPGTGTVGTERLAVPPPRGKGGKRNENEKEKEKLSFWKAFSSSVAMIVATEIGDKTFFIAAVLSMRNARSAVFGGAILALIVMTILSTMMGLVLPSFLPRVYTHIIGGLLFLYFGVKLVFESRTMAEGRVSDELEEVEEELAMGTSKKDDLEKGTSANGKGGGGTGGGGGGGSAPSSGNGPSLKKQESGMSSAAGYSSNSWEKIFLQSLTLTFVAEWGDRSQIATIALAAAKDPYGVTLGGCLGHSMCTGMAVIGGRMLASRISEKTVTFWGGWVFLAFGIHSLFFET